MVLAVGLLALVVIGGCGDDSEGPSADCYRIEGGKVTLVGQNIDWDKKCLRVNQGTEVTFNIVLKDRGVEHNLEVSGPSGEAETELEPGPATQKLVYDVKRSGHHEYVCKIHPNMDGDLWSDPA